MTPTALGFGWGVSHVLTSMLIKPVMGNRPRDDIAVVLATVVESLLCSLLLGTEKGTRGLEDTVGSGV